jgi:hypothetical protein
VRDGQLIVGKYLHQILSVIAEFAQTHAGNLSIISLLQLESKLNQLFAFAEEREIIPQTDESHGWKKGMLAHQELFAQLQKVLEGEAGGEDESGDQPDEQPKSK